MFVWISKAVYRHGVNVVTGRRSPWCLENKYQKTRVIRPSVTRSLQFFRFVSESNTAKRKKHLVKISKFYSSPPNIFKACHEVTLTDISAFAQDGTSGLWYSEKSQIREEETIPTQLGNGDASMLCCKA